MNSITWEGIAGCPRESRVSLVAPMVNPTCNVGDLGSVPGLERSPGGGHGNPVQYSSLESPHGQGSLEGYGPWGLRVQRD